MATLPQEMIFNILSWIPVNALFRFRCVCKSWQSLVSDPCFIKTYNDQSNNSKKLSVVVNNYGSYLRRLDVLIPFVASDDDTTSVSIDIQSSFNGLSVTQRHLVGSCAGLVCFHDHDLDVCCVLNPFTGDFEKLPMFDQGLAYLGHFYSCVWGFGSSSKAQDFKVLKIEYFRSDWHSSDKQAAAFIHTVNSNSSSWRMITEPIDYYIYPDTQVVVDGNPHWRGTYLNGPVISLKIVVFNVAEERFQELPYPDFEDEKYSVEFMGVLRGSICIFRCFYSGLVEVWVMEEYGIKESWKRIFSFTEPKLGDLTRIRQRHLWFLPSSDILVVAYDNQIVLYEPLNGCFQELIIPNTGSESRLEAVACTEKLVLLKGRNARLNPFDVQICIRFLGHFVILFDM